MNWANKKTLKDSIRSNKEDVTLNSAYLQKSESLNCCNELTKTGSFYQKNSI